MQDVHDHERYITACVVGRLLAPAMIDGHFRHLATDLDTLRRTRILKTMVAEQAEEISGDRSIRLRQNKVSIRPQRAMQKLQERVKVGALIQHI